MRSELRRKTQAAIAERIADLEELDTVPRDLVSRVFREQAVDAPSIARIAAALGVDPLSLYKDDAPREDAHPDSAEEGPAASRGKAAPPWRPGFPRLLAWTTLAILTLSGTVVLTSFALSGAHLQTQAGERTLRGFYAEIGDVYRHYLYSEDELVTDPADAGFDLHLGLAAYGDFAFSRAEIARIGMHPDEIRWAMELLLLVRNNDLRIAEIRSLADDTAQPDEKIAMLQARLKDARDVAYSILASLHARRTMTGDLPPPPENYHAAE